MYARLIDGQFSNNGKAAAVKLELSYNEDFTGHLNTGLFEFQHEAIKVINDNGHTLIVNLD